MVPARQARPLAVRPVLEFLRVREMESIEERSAVDGDRRFRVIAAECRVELPEVASQAGGVEAKVVAGALHRVFAQGRAQDVERVSKQVSGLVGAVLGPQRGEEAVPAEGTGMLDSQAGQQRDALPQRGATAYGAVRAVE